LRLGAEKRKMGWGQEDGWALWGVEEAAGLVILAEAVRQESDEGSLI
jgi:hypothetical protein